MVLAGQRPEVIMEIASRGMAFWAYQCRLNLATQTSRTNYERQKLSQLKRFCDQNIQNLEHEITS